MIIQSVNRALGILSLFGSTGTFLGISEIAAAMKMNKGTVWGLVTTLEQDRFLRQDPETHKYTVGPRLFELGMVYAGSLEINAHSSRQVQQLANRTGLNARVGVFEGGMILTTLMALPKSHDSLSHQIGPRIPAYCSGLGKAILAYLPPDELTEYLQATNLVRHTPHTIVDQKLLLQDLEETRERGYSINREEMISGVAALGTPVFSHKRRLAGAISVSHSSKILLGDRRGAFVQELLSTASEIARAMGYYLSTENMQAGSPLWSRPPMGRNRRSQSIAGG
jgi:DNA-binding IclR family transcriptional regulator